MLFDDDPKDIEDDDEDEEEEDDDDGDEEEDDDEDEDEEEDDDEGEWQVARLHSSRRSSARYWIASATWDAPGSRAPARSAMVRASRSVRA